MEPAPRTLSRRTIAAILGVGAVVGIVVGVVLGGDEERTAPISGTPKEAVETVEGFKQALLARDFARICDELYTVEAREAAGGDDCQSILAQESAKLRSPALRIVSLSVAGGRALVRVEASQAGERPAQDTITLVRQGGRFRIASAGPA